MNKLYDAKKVQNLIDDLENSICNYELRASDLYEAMQAYINNDQYRGVDAEASKDYIATTEIPLLEKIIEAQKHLLSLYKHMQDSFHQNVDEADDARIEIDVLNKVKDDFSGFYDRTKRIADVVEKEAAYLDSKYGNFTSFVRPNFDNLRSMYENLVGGEYGVGYIQECIDRLIAFDEAETAYAKERDFSGYVDEISAEIDRINEALSNITVLSPNMDLFSLFLAKYTDRTIAIGKIVEYIGGMASYLLGTQKKCSKCVYDPVNICNGNYVNERVDINLKGRHPLEFKRFYNALSNEEGALGLGWSHSFEKRICEENNKITIDYPDGSKGSFVVVDSSNPSCVLYREEHGEPGILEVLTDGYFIRRDSGEYEKFDSDGYLIAMGDNDGENISLSYKKFKSGKMLLSKVEAKNKNSLTFFYYEDELNKGLIEKVTDQSGRSVCYTYEN